MKLPSTHEQFVLHWGEMGQKWGINRTTAQVHALLLCSEDPLHAQEISESLEIARSNISTAIRELQGWELIHTVPIKGDRKDYFTAEKSVWEVLSLIARKRVEREILPTLTFLRDLKEQEGSRGGSFGKLLQDFIDIFESCIRFYERLASFPKGVTKRILKLDQKLKKLVGD